MSADLWAETTTSGPFFADACPEGMARHAVRRGWSPVALHWIDDNGVCSCPKGKACTSAGKHPIQNGWASAPALSLADVAATWDATPRANVGIRTGAPSRFWVLDIDDLGALDRLEAEHGDLPATVTYVTGSGGLHLLFAMPADGRVIGNSAGRVAPGVDVRGDGGQIVGPMSASDKGSYFMADHSLTDVVDAPEWLLTLVAPGRATAGVPATSEGPVYAELDERARARADGIVAAARTGELGRLDAMAAAATPDGRGYVGERWDDGIHAVACNLAELALASWTAYTLDDVQADLTAHAPTDAGWTVGDTAAKYQAALTTIGGVGRAAPSDLNVDDDWSGLGSARVPDSPADLFETGERAASHLLRPAEVGGHQLMVEHFAADHRGKLLHVDELGWHEYDGTRWVRGGDSVAVQAMSHTYAKRIGTVMLKPDGKPVEPSDSVLFAALKSVESGGGARSAVELAEGHPALSARVDELDVDPLVLNVANGTLDLRTFELRPHDAADKLTKIARGAYVPDAPAKRWPGFLTEVLPDPDVRDWLQRFVGVSLLGVVREHILAVLVGEGRNGKGALDRAVRFTLGSYAIEAEPELFLASGGHPAGQADLLGVRFASVSESDQGRRFAEATVKRLTGGDTIRARRMYGSFFEFEPSHSAMLVTNRLPIASGDDPALWRRMRVVPFNVVIPPAAEQNDLDDELRLDADAILTWAVEGLRAYAVGGLPTPDAVRVRTEEYRYLSDSVARFIGDELVATDGGGTTTALLHSRYAEWARAEGAEPLGSRALGQALDRLGYRTRKGTGGVRLRGLLPLHDAEPFGGQA